MAHVKEVRHCKRCGDPFNRHNGNTDAKYCSRLCACRDRNTVAHQKKAGKSGGKVNGDKKRGTGTKGYIKINQIHEHRTIAERVLGRKLRKGEIVHHKDENKHNNAAENLQVMTQAEHARHHGKINYQKGIIPASKRRNRLP